MTTILILGGLAGDGTRQFLPYLVSDNGPKPSFIRVVDKPMVIVTPSGSMPSTTYLDSDVQAALRDLRVAYSQANLLTEAARTAAFTLPDAHAGPTKSFDYVFDFTGEHDFDLPEPVHVERTIKLAIALGRTALVHKVGVYARILSPFYRLPGDKKGQVGAPDGAAAEPWGVRAAMHHEAARALALIDGLNFVLLRPGLMYGDFVVTGITPRLLVAEVYKFLGEKLEFLWAEGLAQSTVHVKDCAVAAIKAVEWAAKTPKEERLKLAGEELPTTLKSNELIKGVDGAAKKEDAARAVVFNLVDDGATTQADIAKAVGEAVGVESGFHGTIISSFAKLNMGDVLEDVNEKHLEAWSDLLTASDPPISTALPISPHIPADLLQPYPINFSSSKPKTVLGFEPQYKLSPAVLKRAIDNFKKEGNWPVATPRKKSKK